MGDRVEPPLLPTALRRRTTVVVVVAVVVFALLAARYAGGSSARWLDHRTEKLVDELTPRSRWIVLLIEVGSPLVVVVTAFLTALVCLLLRRRRLALLAVLGPGAAGACAMLFQPLVGRTIEGDWAYPSGHTAGATSLALLAAFVLAALLRPDPPRAAALIAGIGALAGTSMTVLLVAAGWHYATDAVGGFLVAVAAVLGVALLIDALADRRREPDTVYTRRG
ncbi:undecaprenyl-diphosphatase [Pseudonocardia hierapolitana]|uniref:Undecaprenyl-diphosphatase n=1 Tax=Pseudonocardia hierapolitana TaxID=1128676 RepID=A0A561SVZ3_9PSEU|nr:undecaprenyl-diphosphatase [Pseudonocardia hierapolitana]